MNNIDITIDENVIVVNEPMNKKYRPLWSTTRSLIMNMMVGVTQGHSLTLKIVGVGFKAEFFDKKQSKRKILNLKKDQRIVNYH